ncbi:MAG: hypothetical protein AAF458_13035 [Pseudomonadota bacterium]
MSQRARTLHANPWRGVFYITGGGTELIAEMLTTPGASRTVLEVSVPYAFAALSDLLGRAPEQACAAPTARAMEMAAFERARQLHEADDAGEHDTPLFGFGATASLATDREKRGRHRAHVAVQTQWHTHFAEIELKGDRSAEEAQLLEALWRVLNETLEEDTASHPTIVQSAAALANWRTVLMGAAPAVVTHEHDGQLLLSGSFNPVHHGHETMLSIAEQLTGRTGAFELSITNADKPALDYHEIGTRLAQFERPVWLTRLPTFVEKARHFPNCVFAVGVDTITRIDAIRYYQGEAGRDAAVAFLRSQGCRFLVFGRVGAGAFLELGDVEVSGALASLCDPVPGARFRADVSSTELRSRDARP